MPHWIVSSFRHVIPALVVGVSACGAADDPVAGIPQTSIPPGDTAAFRAAVENAAPGDIVEIPHGEYGGPHYFTGIKGEPGRPIIITAADPSNPPHFTGGSEGLHFVEPAHLEIRNLVISGQATNGLNIDDGGDFSVPAQGILIENLHVFDIGPDGNKDGIKLSGLVNFEVRNCLIERWGSGGSGIDMVGCHDGLIHDNTFKDGGSTGIQAKGGSANIAIRQNRFENSGARAVNVGGSTGLQFFRPHPHQGFEAKDITVEGNIFLGSAAPVAFVNTDGSTFQYNTIYNPTGWIVRILQERTESEFVPSRNGVFTDNLVVYRRDTLSDIVNIGPGTAPETFTFARNLWYAEDAPANSTPALPSDPTDAVVGVNPRLSNPASGDVSLSPNSPPEAGAVGAHALP